MEFGILGPLTVRAGAAPLPLHGAREEKLLAALLLEPNRSVRTDRLIEAVWGDCPPATGRQQVHNTLAAMRRRFIAAGAPADLLLRTSAGFVINVAESSLDAIHFDALATRARALAAVGEAATALRLSRSALDLWRGPALAGLDGRVFVSAADRLEEERLACLESRIEIELGLGGQHSSCSSLPAPLPHLVPELAALAGEHPLRERLVGLWMRALYREGRRSEALGVYAAVRTRLAEELGLDPGPELMQLHEAILRDEPGLLSGPEAAPAAAIAAAPARLSPAELPADLVDFVGRRAETDRVLEILRGSAAQAVPICAIVGQPGVGKTSLAVHVAHRLRASYPDGQLFVDLRGADQRPLGADDVLARFLRALGTPGAAIPRELQERAALYRSLLADRRVLVVLDNAADAEQARPLLPGTPSCAVLVTSRDRLAGLVGSASVDLDVLATDGALALLDRAGGEGRVRAEPRAARELVRLCGGLPLALRVVGVKLATSPHRTLSALVARLADEQHRLDQLAHGGLAVRRSLDFSYRRLAPADQILLRRAALLDATDFAGWTAAAVADQRAFAVEEGLDRLVGAHLLQAAGPDRAGQVRYRMHDLIRVYARERAVADDSPDDRLAAVRRALHHWIALVTNAEETLVGPGHLAPSGPPPEEVTPDPATLDRIAPDPLAWLDAERSALVATVRQAADLGLLAGCVRLACTPIRVFDFQVPHGDEITTHTIALDAARRIGDRRAEGTVLAGLARIEIMSGRWAQGRPAMESAERALLAAGERHGLVLVYRELGNLDRFEGRPAAAQARYEAMVRICREIDDPVGEAFGLRGLAQIRLAAGQPERALGLLDAALAAAGRVPGRAPRPMVLYTLGLTSLELGRTSCAEAAFREALSWCRRVGDVGGEVVNLAGLAGAALADGDLDEAERLMAIAYGRQHLARDKVTRGNVLLTYAQVRLARGMAMSAAGFARQAVDTYRQLGASALQAQALDLIADSHQALGNVEAAASARAEAAALPPTLQPA
jgi:DNA-binding SARP family transcriptional activator/tetratricopeptide (TPR) repeat protein